MVAIIAILAALLLPALKGARDKAKQASCISNLKQIGLGVGMYIKDYNGWVNQSGVSDSLIPGKLFPYVYGRPYQSSDHKEQTILCCPSAYPWGKLLYDACWRVYGGRMGASGSDPTRNYYRIDRAIVTNGPGAKFGKPSKFIHIADSSQPNAKQHPSCYRGGDTLTVISVRHSGTANCLFADQHFKALTPSGLPEYDIWGYRDAVGNYYPF